MSNTANYQILLISISNLRQDPRVLAHLSVLARYGEVTTIGFGQKPDGATHHLELVTKRSPIRTLLLLISLLFRLHFISVRLPDYASWCKRFFRDNLHNFDLICANDVNSLHLATWLSKWTGSQVWIDMHEYAPLENEGDWKWRLLIKPLATSTCRRKLPTAGAISTVSNQIKIRYESESGRHVNLIRNTAEFRPRQHKQGEQIGSCSVFQLVHIGAAIRARRLENMIDAIKDLGYVTLDLFLLPTDRTYFHELVALADGCYNIRFRSPIPNDEIIPTLSHFDCGIVTIPPTNYNYANCLPNKFFQYVQARIPVISGPTPEPSAIIQEFGIGWVCEDFSPQAIRKTILTASREDRALRDSQLDFAAIRLARQYDDLVRSKIILQLLAQSSFHKSGGIKQCPMLQ